MSTITTTAVARYQPIMTELEQSTLLGFLAGYRGFTREAYALDLRSSPPGAGSTTSAGLTSTE